MNKRRYKNIIVLIILFNAISCSEYKTTDLTGMILLKKVSCHNDSVDFFIKNIILTNPKIPNGLVLEDPLIISIQILIRNKTYKPMLFDLCNENTESCFGGVIPKEKDTIFFIDAFNISKIIPPKDSSLIEVSARYPVYFHYNEKGDNTIPLLNLLKEMSFFYIPQENYLKKNDTISLRNQYYLGISNETQISSENRRW